MIGKNNPFNIRYNRLNHWKGQIGQTRGFCDFENYTYGVRAAAYLLMISYRKRGINTIRGIIYAFAPPSENNTSHYISYVSFHSDIDPDKILDSVMQYCIVLQNMAYFESHSFFAITDIYRIIKHFNLSLYEKK